MLDRGDAVLGTDMSVVDRAAREAVREFGFADVAVTAFEQLPRGIRNLNYRVRAEADDWVLKCHQGAGMAARRAATHDLELALDEAGVPVAKLRRTRSGSTLVSTDAGVFTMHAWVDGQQISIAERDSTHLHQPHLAAELGTVVGMMHRESGTTHTGGSALTARELVEGPRRSVASIQHGPPHRFRKVRRLRLRSARSDFDEWILASLPGLYRGAAALASSGIWSGLAQEDAVLDHHDVNWENVVFDPGFSVLAVLDFDNACVVPRGLAVGGAAAVLVGPDEGRLDEFVAAYSQVVDVAPDPWAVNVGMHLKCLQSTLRSVDAYLSGRVMDTSMVEPWCRHLEACRLALPPVEATS